MIHENQENEHLTNNLVTILVSVLLGVLAGTLTMLLPER
jgi:hypothetical protein